MIAVFNTAQACHWAKQLGHVPWPLLPVSNRPLLDYWLESCTEQGIGTVHVVLGEDAKQVEDFIGDGSRWNVEVEYAFARNSEEPLDYLKSISSCWENGLFYIGGAFFMRRRQAFSPAGFQQLEACRHESEGDVRFLYGKTATEIDRLLAGNAGSPRGIEQIHLNPYPIDSIKDYFDLNMKMVKGEFTRYVTAGFSSRDGSSIGYNVRTPPSSHLKAPIMIGDDCRFGAMTTVGPNAVVANHVIVDAYSELSDCLILDDTYVGRNLEIQNKIVAGNRVIDPADGTVIEIEDSWLVAQNRPDMRTEDFLRYVILWFFTVGLIAIQIIPFCILFPLVAITRIGGFTKTQFHDPRTGYITLPVFNKLQNRKSVVYRVFRALSLDRFPWLLRALWGKLFLCGQPPMRHPADDEIIKQLPHYYPGVFCYQDYNKDSDRLSDSLWYAHIRSLYEDVKILIKALVTRFLSAGRQ
jgi:hypothetical protein